MATVNQIYCRALRLSNMLQCPVGAVPMHKADQQEAIEQADEHSALFDLCRISETRYRRLFEAARDGVLIIDPVSRKITDANPFIKALLGYSHEELVGRELYEIGLLEDERASQDMFTELIRSGQVRYDNLPLENRTGSICEVEVVANVYDENGRPVIQCNIRDIAERKRREAHNKFLNAEVNHRTRNLLAVVQAIARQTSKHPIHASFLQRLTERIGGLAATQDLLVENEWKGVQLGELIKAQLAPFENLFGSRIRFDGQPARLNSVAAQGIGMALHELSTNAGKCGALSNSEGRVHISWQVVAKTSVFSMSWVEESGPFVVPPTQKGFCQIVIKDMIEASVRGTAEIQYKASGFSWRLQALSNYILEPMAAVALTDRYDK